MKKQIKILAMLGTVSIIGGVSALSILTTSCGGTNYNGPTGDISSIIPNNNLGTIDNKHQTTIQAAIISQNPTAAALV
jgi:hypothetical protein